MEVTRCHTPAVPPPDWSEHEQRERERYEDGERRLPDTDDPDSRQRQLTRMGNAAGGAGLALLMQNRTAEAAEWLARAAQRYPRSVSATIFRSRSATRSPSSPPTTSWVTPRRSRRC